MEKFPTFSSSLLWEWCVCVWIIDRIFTEWINKYLIMKCMLRDFRGIFQSTRVVWGVRGKLLKGVFFKFFNDKLFEIRCFRRFWRWILNKFKLLIDTHFNWGLKYLEQSGIWNLLILNNSLKGFKSNFNNKSQQSFIILLVNFRTNTHTAVSHKTKLKITLFVKKQAEENFLSWWIEINHTQLPFWFNTNFVFTQP